MLSFKGSLYFCITCWTQMYPQWIIPTDTTKVCHDTWSLFLPPFFFKFFVVSRYFLFLLTFHTDFTHTKKKKNKAWLLGGHYICTHWTKNHHPCSEAIRRNTWRIILKWDSFTIKQHIVSKPLRYKQVWAHYRYDKQWYCHMTSHNRHVC